MLVVAALTFDIWWQVLAPSAAFLLLHAVEGNFLTPAIIGRRLTLNPIFVFATVLFWGWLWGVPGALLAVPILAVFKILCDATPQLRTIGALIGDSFPGPACIFPPTRTACIGSAPVTYLRPRN
ncbi:AI-2E family transporter [Aerophototrophica crusticola]|uniref:AI-2E family transporter n=1 Tax=Aerophototrophica crusticola TaxID=1709002 RepID=UPI00384C39E7